MKWFTAALSYLYTVQFSNVSDWIFPLFKETQREDTPWLTTQTLKRNINIGIRVIGTLNQLFIKFSKK